MRGVKLHELWGYQISAILVHLMPISWHVICRSWNMLANFKLSLGRSWNTKRSPWRFAPKLFAMAPDRFIGSFWAAMMAAFSPAGRWFPAAGVKSNTRSSRSHPPKKIPIQWEPQRASTTATGWSWTRFLWSWSRLWHHTALCGRCPHPAHADPGVHLREATCRTSWCVWFEMIWNDLN